ncbi:MAG: TraM recognition domain-containing protein [Lachnospiraceae bacterium]|nr:TraM recognition domain-containing protein [Lachnospiraceae bacterium]
MFFDKVHARQTIQKIFIISIILGFLASPIYMLMFFSLFLIFNFIKPFQEFNKYLGYFLIMIAALSVIFAYSSGVAFIPSSLGEWLATFNSVRVTYCAIVSLVCSIFHFGNVDMWLVEDAIKKEEESYTNRDMVPMDNYSHVFVPGTTGSGKTTLLMYYIEDSIKKNDPLFIVSGKNGHAEEGSLLNKTKELAKKYKRPMHVVSLNVNDPDREYYNPFKDFLISETSDCIVNATHFSEEHYKYSLACYIKRLVQCLKLADIEVSISSMIDFYKYSDFLKLVEKLYIEKKLTDHEKKEILNEDDIADIAQASRGRFLNLLLGEGADVLCPEGAVSASDAREDGSIFFLDLDSFSFMDFTTAIGAFFVSDMRHVIANEKNPKLHKRIILDELSVYASEQIIPLFNQGRSRGYQVIPATQSISDLNAVSDTFAERILENCNQYAVLRLNSAEDSETMSKIFGTKYAVENTRRANGAFLDAEGTGSKKAVKNFKVSPDAIKELKALNLFYYDKDDTKSVKKIELEYFKG